MKRIELRGSMSLFLMSLLLMSLSVSASSVPDFPFVSSKGQAEKKVAPDKAMVDIRFLAFNEKSEVALHMLNKSSENVFSVLEKYSIDIKKLDARDIRKDIKRQRDREYNSLGIIGYEVSRSMTLTLDDVKDYALIMNDLIAIDNLTSISTQFDTKDRDSYEAELMNMAGADARRQAQLMAASLGAKIQSVYAISQDSGFGGFLAIHSVSNGHTRFEADMMRTAGKSSGDTKMLIPEFISITQSINAVFRIK